MRCQICDEEVDKIKVVSRVEVWNNQEHSGREWHWCKKCFLSEWDCREFGYKTKKEAEKYFNLYAIGGGE